MDGINAKRNWWIVLVGAAILAFAVVFIQRNWLPEYDFAAFLIAIALLGLAFYWVYALDKEAFWWSLIPALAMAILLVAGIVGYFTPKDASGSSPYAVVALGLGAALAGLAFKRPQVQIVFYVIAIITLLVGILMLPLALIWKIILIVLEVALIGVLAFRTYRNIRK